MSKLSEQLDYFKRRQVEILEMETSIANDIQSMISEHEKKQTDLKKMYEDQIEELQKPLKNKAELYKAELKAWLGFTDGEKSNVLQMIEGVAKVIEESKQ